MSKRIRNYRAGDRAEDLGVYLLRSFCAVAPIPRQEDFGLADAVATLLRGDDRFWFAEDSFLVQFKSRTERRVRFDGVVFDRWKDLDLSILVARINLNEGAIELFTLGAALWHPQLHEAGALVAWLKGGNDGLEAGELHIRLHTPMLRWSVASTEDRNFTERTYGILKEWLRLERWNRRYFKAGVSREIRWATDAMPEPGDRVHSWAPARGHEALADIEPLVEILSIHGRQHPELWTEIAAMAAAIRGPDPRGMLSTLGPLMMMTEVLDRLAEVVRKHPTADVAVTVQFLRLEPDGADFWLYSNGRDGAGTGRRYTGTLQQLTAEGFDFMLDGPTYQIALDRHFATRPIPHEVIDGPESAPTLERGSHSPFLFLRRMASAATTMPSSEDGPEA